MAVQWNNAFYFGNDYGDALFNSYNIVMSVWNPLGDDPQANLLLIMMTVIVVVVMLNMLICFMEKTFEAVYFSQIEWGYKEKVDLICDIYSSISIKNEQFMKSSETNELLFYVREDSANK